MSYSVKEIYYTLQGEGANTGRPAVFLRFAGCNLWSGLQRDRQQGPGGCSQWCDTDFVGVDGPGGGKFATAADLAGAVKEHWPQQLGVAVDPFVVCTGGEPFLQLDVPLLECLADREFAVAVESNGTIEPPRGRYWLTISPKANTVLRVKEGDELKLVYPQVGAEPEQFADLKFKHFFLQPLDGPDSMRNIELAMRYCLRHPQWRLSLQTHKILKIP